MIFSLADLTGVFAPSYHSEICRPIRFQARELLETGLGQFGVQDRRRFWRSAVFLLLAGSGRQADLTGVFDPLPLRDLRTHPVSSVGELIDAYRSRFGAIRGPRSDAILGALYLLRLLTRQVCFATRNSRDHRLWHVFTNLAHSVLVRGCPRNSLAALRNQVQTWKPQSADVLRHHELDVEPRRRLQCGKCRVLQLHGQILLAAGFCSPLSSRGRI